MIKSSTKVINRDSEKTFMVKKVAEIMGVSTSKVYKVLSGDREDEEVFSAYMDLKEGVNDLVEAVKKIVPFSKNVES